jgi:hypothetical protein
MLETLSGNPGKMLGPRRPVADPGREIDVRGDLDQIIAGGLGLDLDVVLQRADAVGIVSALAQTGVPTAFPAGAVKLDERAIAGLRDTLAAEVDAVVSVAARGLRQRTPTATGQPVDAGRRDAGPRDALDELLDALEGDDR